MNDALSVAVAQASAFTTLLGSSSTPDSVTSAMAVAGARASVASTLTASLVSGAATSSAATLSSAATVLASLSSATLADPVLSAVPQFALPMAASVVTGAAAIISAAGATLAPSVASTLVGALADALASTAPYNAPSAVAPTGYNTTSSVPPSVQLPLGGSPAALVGNVTKLLSTLTSALLLEVPAGTPQSVTTAPLSATTPGASYCGNAVTSTAMKPAGGAFSFALAPAMNPCMPTYAIAGRVTLPARIVNAQPPPTLSSTSADASRLAAAAPGATVAITQWGVSPINEAAGVDALSYAPPVAVSDAQLAAAATAAAALANSPVRRILRALGVSAATTADAVIAAVGGTSAATAASGALSGTSPRPTTATDLLPARPLDSRVVSVRVNGAGGGGAPVTLAAGTFVYNITVPYRDLSIVKWDAVLESATVDVGNTGFSQPAITVTCPTTPAAAIARGISATFVRGGVGAAAVRLESSALAAFTGVVGSTTTVGSGGDLNSVAGSGAASADLLVLPGGGGGDGGTSVGALLSARAPTVASSAYAFVLSTDCGPAFGRQSFVCGAGSAGQRITFECPAVVATPACLRFDATKKAWTTAGCSVAASSVTATTCRCDGPGDVAIRFAALAQQQADVFAVGSSLSNTVVLGVWVGIFILLGVVLGLNIFGIVIARDSERGTRWTASMAGDAEMVALEVARGAWAWGGVSGVGGRGTGSAKVVPTSDDSLLRLRTLSGATTPAARIVPISGQGRDAKGGTQSASTAVNAAWVAICEWAAPQRVDAGGIDDALAAWRGARRGGRGLARTRSSTTADLSAYALARLRFGEPPAELIGVASLLTAFSRSPAIFDATGAADAAPRHARLLGALVSIGVSAAGTVLLYAYLIAVTAVPGSPALPTITPGQVVALAFAVALFFSAPVNALVVAVLRWRARGALETRAPALWGEMRRRERAVDVLGCLSTSALLHLADARLTLSNVESADIDVAAPGRIADSQYEGADAATLRAAIAGGAAGSAAGLSVALAVLADVLLAAVVAFCGVYCTAFSLARGPDATSSATGAWALAVTFSIILVHPLAVSGRVALAFTTDGLLSPWGRVNELAVWAHLVAAPAAAAAAAGSGVAAADAALAVIAPEALALVLVTAQGNAAFNAVLRGAALAKAYFEVIVRPAVEASDSASRVAFEKGAAPPSSSDVSAEDAARLPSTASSRMANDPTAVVDPSPPSQRPLVIVPPSTGKFSELRVASFNVDDDDDDGSDAKGEMRGVVVGGAPAARPAFPRGPPRGPRGVRPFLAAARGALGGLNLGGPPLPRPPQPRPRPQGAAERAAGLRGVPTLRGIGARALWGARPPTMNSTR